MPPETLYTFSLVPSSGNPLATEKRTNYEELKTLLITSHPGEKDGTAFIPAIFNHCPPICRNRGVGQDCGGNKRHRLAANVNAITAIALDLDKITKAEFEAHLERLRRLELETFWYETFGSGPEQFKARVIIFFTEPYKLSKPADWAPVWNQLIHHLGFSGTVDKSCNNPDRLYYLPRHVTGGTLRRMSGTQPGKLLPVQPHLTRIEPPSRLSAYVAKTADNPTRHQALLNAIAGRMPTPPPSERGPDGQPRNHAWLEVTHAYATCGVPLADLQPAWEDERRAAGADVTPWEDIERLYAGALAKKPAQPDSVQLAGIINKPTEEKVAGLFETEYGEQFRYCADWKKWFSWTGSYWEHERTDMAFDYCRTLAVRINPMNKTNVAKASFARAVEQFARASRTFATTPDQWDLDTWSLNTPAGLIDLRTGDVRANRPEDLITRQTAVAPLPGPRPVFDRFMREICGGDEDLVAFHQQSLGAMLSGATDDHWLLFWIGAGGNGKNTLGDLVARIVGPYAKSISSDVLMESATNRHATDIADLQGLRLAIASEVAEGHFWNESLIKSLTGDATLAARFMHGNWFRYKRTHKHLIFGNHRPSLRSIGEDVRRRLHIVPFRVSFLGDKADPHLGGKLWAEAPAVLAWLIDGHRAWYTGGQKLRQCSAVQAETTDYLESQSTPEQWVATRCETVHPEICERAIGLYADYARWREERSERPVTMTRWGEWMSRQFRKVKTNVGIQYGGIRLRKSEG
jgi:putative DNA primase/helicase